MSAAVLPGAGEGPAVAHAAPRSGAEGAAAAGQPTVDAEHPWLGLASFTEETRGYFHGREEEVAELGRRVQRKLLTILFGQSGLGKTSILRAGIVPRLRPEGYCPVYVRIDYSPETPPPSEQIKQAIFRATEASGQWTKPGTAVAGESLWEFLHHRDDILEDAAGKTVIPLLIFDQFEEIFTLAQADDAGRKRAAQFIEDLADLVENRPPRTLEARLETDDSITERFDFGRADYRILIALREDYLAHLEGLKGAMPSITQNRMRLARMTGAQALAAVMKPGGRLVSQEVAEAIVRFIAGGSELRNAEVEPSLLSLICRELNNARIAQGRREISADLLAGSNDTILAEFYERALADQPAAVRRFIEDEMLTESGFRESLAEERVQKAFAAAGAAPGALATLVNRRLLRIEERLDLRRVELTHDVLCGVVRASREVRLEREARDEAERQLQAQRARELATRKALVRARQVAVGAGALAVVAIGGAIFGYLNMQRAQEAEAAALKARQSAEVARGEAEKLMVFLLDDFTRELEPTGRIDIVAELAKRAIDYYKGLPQELRTPDTERNRALALVRYGAVLRIQAQHETALSLLEEATESFRKLRAQGDESEATVVGLASALGYRAAILVNQLKLPESVAMMESSLETLRPFSSRPEPSRAVLRLQGLLLVGLGYNKINNGSYNEAIQNLEDARRVHARLGAPGLADISAAVEYAAASGWLGNALESVERWGEARAAFRESFDVAGAVLNAMPGHTRALHTKGIAAGALSQIEAYEFRLGRALELSREHQRLYEALLKITPTSAGAWNNLGVAHSESADFSWRLGRLEESVASYRAAVAVGEKIPTPGSFQARNLAVWSVFLADRAAELGDAAGAAAALANGERLWEKYLKTGSSPFQSALSRQWQSSYGASVALSGGDAARALREAREALAAADALEATGDDDRLWKRRARVRNHRTIALAELRLGNAPAAEVAARAALADWQTLPRREFMGSESVGVRLRTLLALSLARQGRTGEAREAIAPVVKGQRELMARQKEDRTQHFDLAFALYAAALADPGQRESLLAEATAILEGLPPAMGRSKTGALLRGWIAEERGRRS